MTLSAETGRRAEAVGRGPELLRPAEEAAWGKRERDEWRDECDFESDGSDELAGGDDRVSDEGAADDDDDSDDSST
jgi:hypothetical protein